MVLEKEILKSQTKIKLNNLKDWPSLETAAADILRYDSSVGASLSSFECLLIYCPLQGCYQEQSNDVKMNDISNPTNLALCTSVRP